MSPNLSSRLLVALGAVIAGVDIAEATVHHDWDVQGLFSGILAFMVVLLFRTLSGRDPSSRFGVTWWPGLTSGRCRLASPWSGSSIEP